MKRFINKLCLEQRETLIKERLSKITSLMKNHNKVKSLFVNQTSQNTYERKVKLKEKIYKFRFINQNMVKM